MGFIAFIAFLVLMFSFVISSIQGDSWTLIEQLASYIDAIIFYIGQALDIVWIFVPQGIAVACMGVAIAGFFIRYSYKFVMWVLRKIPFMHIS